MSRCPGCRLLLPEGEGATHPYIGSSPACWALFGDILAREYSDPAYFRRHQLTVDTYAVQHPGRPERRSVQSVALHLVTLCLILEDGADPGDGPTLTGASPSGTWSIGSILRSRTAGSPSPTCGMPRARPSTSAPSRRGRVTSGERGRRITRPSASGSIAAWPRNHGRVLVCISPGMPERAVT